MAERERGNAANQERIAVPAHFQIDRLSAFGLQAAPLDGVALCRMFNQAIAGQGLPARLSLNHDPLFTFQRWQANLRLLEIEAIQTVPYAPVSHPFIERLIGTLRREYLDHCFFWNQHDLEKKLAAFRRYYNRSRGELIIFAWAAVFWLPCRTGESQVTSLDHERISVTVRAFAGHPCYFGWTGWRQGGSRPKSSAQTPAPDYQTLTETGPQPLCLPEVVFGRLVIVSEPTPAVTQCRCS